MDEEKEIKKTELQKEFFKKCHEEGFSLYEMANFDGYLYALLSYIEDLI